VEKLKEFSDPLSFRASFLNQVASEEFDVKYKSFINVILYFVWLGITSARKMTIQGNIDPGLGFLCLATYKSFLPIIQNLRLGYTSSTIVLLRAQMEQIALLGFLNSKPELIPKYTNNYDLKEKGLSWMKDKVENWAKIYSYFSSVAHPTIRSTSVQIYDNSILGNSLNASMPLMDQNEKSMSDEVIAGIVYSLFAMDNFNKSVIGRKLFDTQKNKYDLYKFDFLEDLKGLMNFLQQFITKYQLA